MTTITIRPGDSDRARSRGIPVLLSILLKCPRAELSRQQKRSVDLYESILRYELFGQRWDFAVLRPVEMTTTWTRCSICQIVLIRDDRELYFDRVLCNRCTWNETRGALE